MKFLCQGVQKLLPEQTETQTHRHTDRQTDTQTDMTENITYLHTRVVNICQLSHRSQEVRKSLLSANKVMFLHLSVTGERFVPLGRHTHPPLADTPLGRHPPWAHTPPGQTPSL